MNAFDVLPLGEKLRMIKHAGEYITTIQYSDSSVSLYRLNKLLVEIHFDNLSKKTLKISSAPQYAVLKYFPQVPLNSLYRLVA